MDRSLLNCLRSRDTVSDLWRRLNTLPRELDSFYDHLFGLIEPIYLSWASRAFQIFRACIEIGNTPPGDSKGDGDLIRESTAGEMMVHLTLAVFYFAINDHAFFGLQDMQAMYTTVV